MVLFAAATGLRPGEWLALERRDIDRDAQVVYVRRTLRNGRIKTPKTKASLRAVPLQAIALSAQKPGGAGLSFEAEIVDRSYLGEYWDYQVRPLGGTKPLRVSTAPTAVFEVGSRVWLEIAPSAMVRVE